MPECKKNMKRAPLSYRKSLHVCQQKCGFCFGTSFGLKKNTGRLNIESYGNNVTKFRFPPKKIRVWVDRRCLFFFEITEFWKQFFFERRTKILVLFCTEHKAVKWLHIKVYKKLSQGHKNECATNNWIEKLIVICFLLT